MTITSKNWNWNPPTGATGKDLGQQDIQFLRLAVNVWKGHHAANIARSVVVQPDERMLLLGPQTTPVGVVVTLQPGSVMTTL